MLDRPEHWKPTGPGSPAWDLSEFDNLMWPELAEWEPVLVRIGLDRDAAVQLALKARIDGVSLQREILASGAVSEAAFYRALAADLGLPFIQRIDPRNLVVSDVQAIALLRRRAGEHPAAIRAADGARPVILATDRLNLGEMRARIRRSPDLRRNLWVATPTALREALAVRAAPLLLHQAVFSLFNRFPQHSARFTTTGWQGLLLGSCGVALVIAAIVYPVEMLVAFHALFSFFFLACVVLRIAALPGAAPAGLPTLGPVQARELPVYSVLVALYREAQIVPELLVALGRLEWPRAKLDIKLVCEKDDRATIDAIRVHQLRPWVEIVEVPRMEPRTKPKALAYALPTARGEFVVLYDAEDKPHPMQLIEAWQKFRSAGPELACLQAPLEISNRHSGALARMFACEYSALFHGLLPWLARRGLVLPLGGTSNHFRRRILDEVGGWDPFNVTEDADLGLRLARFGYRTDTISTPTYEVAPENLAAWRPQRSRWFKGWAQTWLVHMRHPFELLRQLGPGSFVITQILFAGMVLSALTHPALIVAGAVLAYALVMETPLTSGDSWLLAVDAVNVMCGYVSFLVLGWKSMRRRERRGFWKVVAFMPVYWLLMSFAALRAVWDLWRRPHLWEKTPHPASASPAWEA